jgi:predicted AlkP superfamily pyrophosphatase or phosphodiesterase
VRRAVLFVVTLLAACAARSAVPVAPVASNGDRPLVILVSFDGWRWDYETKAPTPNFHRLAARGVRAGLIPVYPSKTFPNHYTIATGLYPGHHGMVANVIRDPATGRVFRRTDLAEARDPMWWGGEPIWNVARRAGLVAATMFWIGSEVPVGGMQPNYWREFDETVMSAARVDQVLEWLDLPAAARPSMICLYLNETDDMGHWYGPDSAQLRDAVERTDEQLGRLGGGLERRGLIDRANIVVVSDHGMAATSADRVIYPDDYLAPGDAEIVDINPTLGVVPAPGREAAVARALLRARPHLKMYRREDTPRSWRLRDQPRVPPLTGVADEGWVVLSHAAFNDYWKRSRTGGQHGYDPSLESMRGVFAAAGPAFRRGRRVAAFENVSVYNVLARVLGVRPPPNDGDPGVLRAVLN